MQRTISKKTAAKAFDIINGELREMTEDQVRITVLAAAQHILASMGRDGIAVMLDGVAASITWKSDADGIVAMY